MANLAATNSLGPAVNAHPGDPDEETQPFAIDTDVFAARSRPHTATGSLSILVVDDDPIELALIGDQLEERGFEVARAASADAALRLMDERCYPVLLTDWQMPSTDGIELVKKVRARGMTDTYIIMLTAKGSDVDFERGYDAGIDDYLLKQLPPIELFARVHAAFNTVTLRQTLQETQAQLSSAKKRLGLTGYSKKRASPSAAIESDADASQIIAMPFSNRPKVLVVDDDELMRERLRLSVSAAGHEVLTAVDGAEALAILQREFIPIVILDRDMPTMDGLAFCRTVREQSWSGYLYLILLTAHDGEEDILGGLEAGADDYVSKRASEAQLVARLSTALRILTLERTLQRAVDERRRLAMTDPLTGAHNRRYFMRYMNAELKRSRRFGSDLSLLALDIDHFKQMNDLHGHAAGDVVLQQFAQCIKESLPRDYDWCARLGGEEFAVVLPQTDVQGAAIVAEKLRIAVERMPVRTSRGIRSVTVSIGVCSLQSIPSEHGVSPTVEQLLAAADTLMYASKEAGRNRVTTPTSR